MLQAVAGGPGRLALREVPVPKPGPGEAVVAVEAALTCGTDLKLLRRGHPRIPLPAPLGHEFAGTIAATGAGVTAWREGDAVACVPTAPCGRCCLCMCARENLCPEAVGRMVLGAFAGYVCLPPHIVQTHLFHRPPSMPAAVAAALEPLACVVHGLDRLGLEAGQSVLVLGDGAIGLLFAQLARLHGAGRVRVAGHHAGRLAVAAALGAETTTAQGPELAALIGADGGADRVIECVGEPEVWEQAHSLAAVGGRVLLYGGCAAGTRASFDTGRLHYEEIDVVGAFHYGRRDVRAAFERLTDGSVRIEPLITHEVPLSRLAEALDLARSRQAIKVAVRP
jgi:L-iditol 2-dehydrogenase